MTDWNSIKYPFLLFLADAPDVVIAKTAFGIAQWRVTDCLAQWRLPGCGVDVGLPDLRPASAAADGARSLVIGVAPPGGALPEPWIAALIEAVEAGLDIVSGLHTRLDSAPALKAAAVRHGRALIDVRHPRRSFAVGNGAKRTGKRLLTVGTDCGVGKKYTALAIHAELRRRGIAATFRATGQTGILISGGGVAIDAVVADFVSGAAEWLSPAAGVDHWDIIEGQGSLYHPSYAGVSLALLHGSQPDVFVVCHEPTRRTMTGVSVAVPRVEDVVDLTVRAGIVTNAKIRCAGIAINTAGLVLDDARELIASTQARLGLICTDPIRFGVAAIVDALA